MWNVRISRKTPSPPTERRNRWGGAAGVGRGVGGARGVAGVGRGVVRAPPVGRARGGAAAGTPSTRRRQNAEILHAMPYNAAEGRYDAMPYRRCGRSGLKLPAVSLGLWQNFGDDRPLETSRAILRRAFDLGITHFDLANNYGPPYGSRRDELRARSSPRTSAPTATS